MNAPRSAPAWLAGAAAVALLAAAQHGDEDRGVTPEAAGELFTSRCVQCHVAPDASFATDRAWLAQVHDTA